jgi:hypothetical protein
LDSSIDRAPRRSVRNRNYPRIKRIKKHDERTRFVAVLEIPPVISAETAVRVQIVKDVKEGNSK